MAVVPMLKEVFARVLPVLGAIKHDNMRWVFAAGTHCTPLLYLCIVSLSLLYERRYA
jgi:arginine exporter protein ArgO